MALSTQRKKEQCEVLSVTLLLRWHGEDGTAINTCMYIQQQNLIDFNNKLILRRFLRLCVFIYLNIVDRVSCLVLLTILYNAQYLK